MNGLKWATRIMWLVNMLSFVLVFAIKNAAVMIIGTAFWIVSLCIWLILLTIYTVMKAGKLVAKKAKK